jgi:very-short-patch-repair endonuclease
MKPQEVANTLWALAKFGWQSGKEGSPMHRALEGAAGQLSARLNAQDVANMLWALATLAWQAVEAATREALEEAVVRVAPSMKPQEVANTLWGIATLGWQAGQGAMQSALEGATVRVAPSMNAQDAANVLWALAALGWKAGNELAACFEHLVDRFVSDSEGGRFTACDSSQLLQAHLASQFLGLGLVMLPPQFLQVALEAYREQKRKVTTSIAQREIGESLCRLRIAHELECFTADGLFSIDLAIIERRIAIEVDGPSHFTTNTLEPLGHTRLRDRLLSAMGWQVVSIPFFEWDGLHQKEQRDAYVERRLLGSSS